MLDNELANILEKKKEVNNKSILVLSGGGIKGISQLGALKVLDEQNILKNIITFAGTSVGATICALLVVGYTPDELFEFITVFDLKKIKSEESDNIFKSYGLDDGKNINIILRNMFIKKKIDPDITFIELYKKTLKKLILTSSCINDKKVYYFSHETTPDMNVIKAIKMSISIPILFSPTIHEDKMFIDGACIDNYPIELFGNTLDSVVGIYVKSKSVENSKIHNIEDYLTNLIQCIFEGVITTSIKGYEKQTIKIDSDYIAINFDISKEDKSLLFLEGYTSAKKYFSN